MRSPLGSRKEISSLGLVELKGKKVKGNNWFGQCQREVNENSSSKG